MKKGGIQPGTTASSHESILSEQKHIDWVLRAVSKRGPKWKIKKSQTSEEMRGYKTADDYSRKKDGSCQEWQADGGFIFYEVDGEWKRVGVCENKFQDSRENACERGLRYLSFLEGPQIFIACEGPGFEKKNGGGSTGTFIDMALHAGITVLVNPSDAEYELELERWLDSLVAGL